MTLDASLIKSQATALEAQVQPRGKTAAEKMWKVEERHHLMEGS